MNKPINELIVLLDQLMDLQDKDQILKEEDGEYFTDLGHVMGNEPFNDLMGKINILLNKDFITSEGQPDEFRIKMLDKISDGKYSIIRGEYDSFGWLTGVVVTPRGKITYG